MQTDVEVLKSRLESLDKSVSSVNGKLDVILSMQIQLVRLQEQHDNTREALDRAFTTLRTVEKHTTDTEKRLNHTLSFVRGGVVVGSLLFAFVQWYVIEQINTIRAITNQSAAFERRIIMLENKTLTLWPKIPNIGDKE